MFCPLKSCVQMDICLEQCGHFFTCGAFVQASFAVTLKINAAVKKRLEEGAAIPKLLRAFCSAAALEADMRAVQPLWRTGIIQIV